MDDVAVVATPRTGFMAIAEYIKNIGRTAGVRIEKVEVYAPWLGDWARFPLGFERIRTFSGKRGQKIQTNQTNQTSPNG